MPALPIWKDYYVNAGPVTSDSFMINSAVFGTVYAGTAHLRPGQTDLLVKVNEVCADFIEHTLPTMQNALLTPANLPVEFTYYSFSQAATLDTFSFYGDWSYEDGFDYTVQGLAHPINGRIDARQWIPCTAIGVNDITLDLHFKDGTTSTVVVPLQIQADFDADFNADFAISLISHGSGTAFFDLSQWSDVAYVVLNGTARYDVVTECGRYALYYVNAYGGWDTFLVEGNARIEDVLTRNTIATDYDNGSIQARGMRDYAVQIQRGITLHTGYLTDEQSARVPHLLNSTDVYLWDFDTEEMIPLVLSKDVTEHKTYKNNGRRMVDYTIEAKFAKDMVRR
jgi:hypothetical protein